MHAQSEGEFSSKGFKVNTHPHTRRVGETVVVGDEVTVTVLGIKCNQVRYGINAPKRVPVHREEIYERIRREDLAESEHKSKALTENGVAVPD